VLWDQARDMVYNARLVHRLDMLVVVKFGRIDYGFLEDSMRSRRERWDGKREAHGNRRTIQYRYA
jgi:hypothetical protein